MAEIFGDRKTAYHSISRETIGSSGEEPEQTKLEIGGEGPQSDNRGLIRTILLQFAAALWLVPIIILLYFNFSEYIIGASAWCPDKNCFLDAYNEDGYIAEKQMHKYNKEDHNLLGGLQFAAKGLEVWFGIIAAAFVYLVTMRLAGKPEGLPIGYLTRPFEFADITSLADPLLWKTGPTPFGAQKSARERLLGKRVWGLILLTVFLCILSNLMGPATAVLILPGLQWIKTNEIGNRTFLNLNSEQPPAVDSTAWFWWATNHCLYPDLFFNHDFRCTQYPFGNELDSWITSYISSGFNGITQQDELTFQVNETADNSHTQSIEEQTRSNVVFWVPSRQIVSNLSTDYEIISAISLGYSETEIENSLQHDHARPDPYNTYVEYNKSLELQIQRNGPITGAYVNMYLEYNNSYSWVVDIDADRQLRCYSWYDIFWTPIAEGTSSGNYTKCVRTGKGWSPVNKQKSFFARGTWDAIEKKLTPNVGVEVFASDRAVFFPNGTLPSWLPGGCLTDGPILNKTACDWNRLFSEETSTEISPKVANRTSNVNTIEMTIKDGASSATLAVDFVAMTAFTKYQLNPSPDENKMLLVQTQNLPTSGSSIAIDPTWILAGWSVNEGGWLIPNRVSTNLLLEVMQQLLGFPETGLNMGYHVDYLSLIPIAHSLSLIDHATQILPPKARKAQAKQGHPILQRNAQMYVWAYSMGSRTSWLGAIVAMLGGIIVIMQVYLGLVDRRRYRSLKQLIVAALEHAPKGEFYYRREETQMARTRFHIKDNEHQVGKFSFYEPESKGEFLLDRT